MKKIIFFIDVLGVGGAERLMVPILSHLKHLFNVRVCVFREKDGNPIAKEIRELGLPVDTLPIPYLRDLTAIPRLINYIRHHDADLVHTQLELADILGSLAAKLSRIPSVSTIHTLPNKAQNGKQMLHQRVWWGTLKYLPSRIITVAQEARQYFIKQTGIPERKVVMIYNGIDFSRFHPISQAEKRALRQQLGIPANAKLLTTIAMLRLPKGIQYMIQAMPHILASESNTFYLVAGSGDHLEALKTEVKANNIEGKIMFAGMRTDIPQILSISDVFVLPTLSEALPTVLAEAMAASCPIVATRVGGIPEMVDDGINGLIVEPGNVQQLAIACQKLLNSSILREEMGSEGWRIANQKFNILRQADQLKTLYEKFI